MTKFEALSPQEARRLEAKAVQSFIGKVKKEEKKEPPKEEPTGLIQKIKAVFPFQLFPDELLVFKHKLTLITRLGPGMGLERDMLLRDVAMIEADCGPIFGQLVVTPKLRTEEPMIITRLFRKEAIKAREIIEEILEKSYLEKESSY